MNNEHLLQLTKHLSLHGDLKGLNFGDFDSAFRMDGLQILPPLMTEIKRLEMQQLRLQALAIEVALKRNKPALGEKQLKCLMPRMVNASTNTVLPVQNPNPSPSPIPDPVPAFVAAPSPLVVLGRFRQKLQKSETAVYDHRTNKITTLAPAKTLPISMASHLVFEEVPQRAVVKITPIVLGTLRSSWVSKLGTCQPLQRCTTSIELRGPPCQERMPERPVVFPSSTQISKAYPKVAQAPGHASCHEPSAVKTDSANERRRNYGAKVAMKRNEMAKKREELAKLNPQPRTDNNYGPKSIRTPIRRVEAGSEDPELQQQRSRFQSVFARQEVEQQRLQVQELPKTNNLVPKSIRTPIRRVEAGEFPESERNRFPSLISRQEHEQQQGSARAINNQVPKSIRTPIRRLEAPELLEPELLQQKSRLQSLISRQEIEQQRLQTQLEQQQQGLIDQMVGNIATSDVQDTTSELVADPDQ